MKRPAFQWYPGDFRRDVGVQACSFEARSLWREMLDLMHDGEPYGHLTGGGKPIDVTTLARLIGKTPGKVRRWLRELEDRKVFSRTEAGVIYSRRMVRDEHIREVRKDAGKLGGNPNLTTKQAGKASGKKKDKKTRNVTDKGLVNQTDEQNTTPAVAVASASATQQQPAASGDAASDGGEPAFDFAPFAEAWFARYDGQIAATPNVGPIKWLVRKHGAEEVLRRWVIYLAATEAQYASAAKLKSGWGQWATAQVTVSRGGGTRIDTPAQAHAAMLWARYREHSLLTRWEKGEYERIGNKLVKLGHYAKVDDFLAELRVTRPWTLADARTDIWAINEIAIRLAAGPQQAVS